MGNRLSSAPKAHASAPCEATKKDAQPDSSHPGEGAWAWWAAMGHPQKALAPMVGASERAFRMLLGGSQAYSWGLCLGGPMAAC